VYDHGMSELVPCGECRRHVSITDGACPFCGTARESATAVSRGVLSRMSRAAVFAGAALATAACGGNKPKAESVDNNQPAQQADAGVDETAQPDPDLDPRPDPHNIPMPYGAPPARSRLV
jgi:hypothetical protein